MDGKAGFLGHVEVDKVVRNIEVILFLYSYCNIPVMTVCLSHLKDRRCSFCELNKREMELNHVCSLSKTCQY